MYDPEGCVFLKSQMLLVFAVALSEFFLGSRLRQLYQYDIDIVEGDQPAGEP